MTNPSGSVSINGRSIGVGYPTYIVAEMSGNHNGDINRALRIMDAAKLAGADAVKIQTYRPDTITIDHTAPEFIVKGGLWHGRQLFELYQEAHTPWEWHQPIFEYGRKIGITVFSSPFDFTAVDLLESLDAPAYKIASPELIDLPLIRYAAKTGKPLVISTGMATIDEIHEAVDAAREAGASEIVVLHCTAAYPAPIEEANLSTIGELERRFRTVVGLSDHTMGTTIPSLAVVLGAHFIEKHFTLSRSEGGVDSAFSLEPKELAELVKTVQIANASIGTPAFIPTESESSVLNNRRSLYVVSQIRKGELFNQDNIRSIRPGYGMRPKFYDLVLGRRASRDLMFGEPLHVSMIDGGLEL